MERYLAIRPIILTRAPAVSHAALAAVLLGVLCPNGRSQDVSGQKDTAAVHYVRAKDPKWYAKQLVALRQELAGFDEQIHLMRQARKDGGGTTGAVNLDKAPEGADADAELHLLQQHRIQVLQRISEIEDEARRNEVPPGGIRAAEGAIEEGTSADANKESDVDTPEFAETKEALRQEKEHLERAENDVNVLKRKLDLDERTVYSNPEYTVQKSGEAKLTAEQNQIGEKEKEIQQTEQRIAELEERLQDLRLNANKNGGRAEAPVTKVQEKDEAYWREQFADIHYKIRMAQSELDVLQRELNEALLIYDPNPQKALRENITRDDINAHRQAIEDKKEELAELRWQLSELEDELRHAGGDPGWARE